MTLSVKDELEGEVNKLVRATALQIHSGVVLKTPVDTGRARGNWQVSTSPVSAQLAILDKSGGATIQKGISKIGSAKAIKYPTVYITNNLPYIEELNRGTSTQAPAKFVESTIKQVTNGS